MLIFKKPVEIYWREKEEKRRRLEKIRRQELVKRLKEERQKQIDTVAA